MANETKIIISAKTDQAESSIKTLGQSVDSVSRKFMEFSALAGTLAGALSATAFTGFIKSSIDTADMLSKLSQKTGTSVEALAGLKFAADQNGTSLESVANAGKKLAVTMEGNPEIFKKIGVNAKDSTGAMVQIADIFSAMPDGIEKTALAIKLMGKNGAEMIPLLNQGSKTLQDLIDQGKKLLPITAENAKMAQDFNDQMDLMKTTSKAAGIGLSMSMLPALNDIINHMVRAQKEYGILVALMGGVGLIGAKIIGVEINPQKRAEAELNDMLKEQRTLRADIAILEARPRLNPTLQDEEINALKKRNLELIPKIRHQVDLVNAPINEAGAQMAEDRKTEDARKRLAKKSAKELKDALAGGKNTTEVIDPNDAAVSSIHTELFRKQMELYGASAEQIKVYELALKGATMTQIDKAQADTNSISAIKAQLDAEKAAQKIRDEAAKEAQKTRDEAAKAQAASHDEMSKIFDKVNTAAREEMAQMQFETSLLGLNTDEVQRRTEARKIDLALEKELLSIRSNDKFKTRDTNTAVNADYQAAIDAATKAANATKKGALEEIAARNEVTRSWQFGSNEAVRKYLESISNAASQSERLFSTAFKGMEDSLVNFCRHGKLDFASLADSIISEMMRIQIQNSIMQPLAAGMSGGGSGFLGTLGSYLGSVLGMSGGSSAGTGATQASWTSSSMPLIPAYANGASFDGNFHAFADGGAFTNKLFNSPTPFKFASGGGFANGVMGEAGPEAVMPLSRAPNGKLGVVAQGAGAANVTMQVNIINNASQQASATVQKNSSGGFDVIIEQLEGKIANNIARGTGALNTAITHTFGLNRAPGAF